MSFSPKIQAMIDAALAEGFTLKVKSVANSSYWLYKADGRGNISAGIWLSVTETGAFYQAHRLDVELHQALMIRTVKDARKALYLKCDRKQPARPIPNRNKETST